MEFGEWRRYVIIGATAFPVHGYVRATLDVDVFIEPTEENARRTWAALRDFGYDVTDLTIEDMLTKKILIRQYWVETDVHPFVAGVTFDQVWANRVEGDRVSFAPLPKIAMCAILTKSRSEMYSGGTTL